MEDRVRIEVMLDRGSSQAAIARELGCHRSTVSREVRRRSWSPEGTSAAYTPYRPARLKAGPWTTSSYRAYPAQRHAERLCARSHQPFRLRHDRLVDWVVGRLRDGWTPQEIAGRLPVEFAGEARMRISHETVYAWIYSPAQRHRQLWQYLPRGQRRRRKRAGRRVRAQRINWRVSIHDRPAAVASREQFGHWESDSVLGCSGTGAIHTTVERRSRFMRAVKVPDTTADATLRAQLSIYKGLPSHAVASITADNGHEFAHHHKLADTLAIPTYFADPYSAHQRGTIEHFNGRLRRYLPKRTSFIDLTQDELDDYITEINNRPRKCLGWRTPAEVFRKLCSTSITPRCTSD